MNFLAQMLDDYRPKEFVRILKELGSGKAIIYNTAKQGLVYIKN